MILSVKALLKITVDCKQLHCTHHSHRNNWKRTLFYLSTWSEKEEFYICYVKQVCVCSMRVLIRETLTRRLRQIVKNTCRGSIHDHISRKTIWLMKAPPLFTCWEASSWGTRFVGSIYACNWSAVNPVGDPPRHTWLNYSTLSSAISAQLYINLRALKFPVSYRIPSTVPYIYLIYKEVFTDWRNSVYLSSFQGTVTTSSLCCSLDSSKVLVSATVNNFNHGYLPPFWCQNKITLTIKHSRRYIQMHLFPILKVYLKKW